MTVVPRMLVLSVLSLVAAWPAARPEEQRPAPQASGSGNVGAVHGSLASIFEEILREDATGAPRLPAVGSGPSTQKSVATTGQPAGGTQVAVSAAYSKKDRTEAHAADGDVKGDRARESQVIAAVSRYLPALRRALLHLMAQLDALEAAVSTSTTTPAPLTLPPDTERYLSSLEAVLAGVLKQEAAASTSAAPANPRPPQRPTGPAATDLADFYPSLESTLKDLLSQPALQPAKPSGSVLRENEVRADAKAYLPQLEQLLAAELQKAASDAPHQPSA